MRVFLLLLVVSLIPSICQADHTRRFGRHSIMHGRHAQAHNRTDYANSGRVQYYQYSGYSYPSIGGYISTTRYPSSWWGPSNPSYSVGYRLGRALRGR